MKRCRWFEELFNIEINKLYDEKKNCQRWKKKLRDELKRILKCLHLKKLAEWLEDSETNFDVNKC